MFVDKFLKLFSSITSRQLMIAIMCICLIVFLYYSFVFEGFSNMDNCSLVSKGSAIARKTIEKLEDKDVSLSRDQINIGHNIRDMQTRDIILGDDTNSWCQNLTKEEKDTVLESVAKAEDTDLYLFDGPGLIDDGEEKSIATGIAYAGADKYDNNYAKA